MRETEANVKMVFIYAVFISRCSTVPSVREHDAHGSALRAWGKKQQRPSENERVCERKRTNAEKRERKGVSSTES